MAPERLEAFSDGVFAVIITITVLDVKAPPDASLSELKRLAPLLASYALSFANIGIYWNNHHHMFQAVRHINGKTMWLNLHLLFWLSLIPISTTWQGNHFGAQWPTVVYGLVLFGAGAAYLPLSQSLVKSGGLQDEAARTIGRDLRMPASLLLDAAGIVLSFLEPWLRLGAYLGNACYLAVALMWFWPSRELEEVLKENHDLKKADTTVGE